MLFDLITILLFIAIITSTQLHLAAGQTVVEHAIGELYSQGGFSPLPPIDSHLRTSCTRLQVHSPAMGPPKTRGLRPRPSRSRFHEGSMNDRVSAVPPSQFLGPEELEALERPLEAELEQHSYNLRSSRRSQDTTRQLQLFMSRQAPSIAPSIAPSFAPSVAPSVTPSTATTSPKKGVLGQVWEGVRGRFKLKKEPASPEQKKLPDLPKKPATGVFDDRPTREEALASYHLLVEAGFFTTHAIQSTRQPPPPGFVRQRPATSHQALSPSLTATTPPPRLQPLEVPTSLPPPPKWPLNSTPITPKSNRTSLSAVTPASADSRGTKRTANEGNADIQIHQDEPPRSPRSPRTRGKKIRKTASKEFGIPILRTARSRRKLAGSRANARKSGGNASLPPVVIHHYHSNSTSSRDSRHSRRSSHLLCATSPSSSAASSPRGSFDSASSARESGESVYSVRAIGSGSKNSRALRPRKAAPAATSAPAQEALKVVPNANRGIPIVPTIPAKYTAGEDRENGQSWRGLKR
ncbi:hypothetical protein V8C35DRAFT_304334 [Trichoderma chlorosporum]